MKKMGLAVAILFCNFPVCAFSDGDVTTALLSIEPSHFKEARLSNQDLEKALLAIDEYRNLSELAQSVRGGQMLSSVELTNSEVRCQEALEQLNERTFFGRRKMENRVMGEVDRGILELAHRSSGVDEWSGRQTSILYRRALNQLLEHAVFRYGLLRAVLVEYSVQDLDKR